MTEPNTVDDVLATEIKQDIASRYFAFRKLIEEDTMNLAEKTRQYSFILQKRISFDLIRLYIMLKDERLIQTFLSLINLNKKFFYDPYITESSTIAQRVFACQRFRGFTKAGRFKNYFLDCYENLVFHATLYGEKVTELQQDRGTISEEIKHFYEQNDISAIFGFLHSLGNKEACSCMQGGMETGLTERLDKKLQIEIPLPIEEVLPVLPPLKPLAEIKSALKRLARQAIAGQTPELLKIFEHKNTQCDQRDILY